MSARKSPAKTTTARTPTLQFYKTRKDLHRWRLRGANGEIMCQGTSVKTFQACGEQLYKSALYLADWPGDMPSAPRGGVTVELVYRSGQHVLTVERLA